MKLTIYSVHSDSDRGSDLEMFLSKEAEQDYCDKLIRESDDEEEALKLLDAGHREEAWFEFTANSAANFSRHETDIELPEPYASAPAMLEALKEISYMFTPCGIRGVSAKKRADATIAKAERSTP